MIQCVSSCSHCHLVNLIILAFNLTLPLTYNCFSPHLLTCFLYLIVVVPILNSYQPRFVKEMPVPAV